MNRKVLSFLGMLLFCGCLNSSYQKVDHTVCEMAAHPFDVSAETPTSISIETPDKKSVNGAAAPDLNASTDISTASWLQRLDDKGSNNGKDKSPQLQIPAAIPGAETPKLDYGRGATEAQKAAYIQATYPPLPPLTEEPRALPGPNGHPYTLDDLQRLAAANSPTLRQAASDVYAAEGNLKQAGTYTNPTAGFQANPSNDNSSTGVRGLYLDQNISTAGKMKLAVAAAQMDLDNAKLALKRARSDLATAVRNAYFALLVSKETVRVTKSVAQFTDEVYRIMEGYLAGGQGALYEPAALRAQARSARLAYRQAIQTYIYNWEQLRATLALRELPLSEVAGRIDAYIPYYDYSVVLNHVLCNHTDLKVATNGIEKARYNLKLAQVQVIPNVDVSVVVQKEMVLAPFQWFYSAQLAMPIPIWDQNRGNIQAAQGALIRAQEEPHRVEASLTNTLANTYSNYKTNLAALEDYRKYILPDQIRVYRGVFARRSVDQTVSLYDLVGAQQTLAASITQYLATLGTLWTSVVSVADLLQTDDLFQLGRPLEMDPVPDLLHLPPLPCSHPCAGAAASVGHPLPQLPITESLPGNPVLDSNHGPMKLLPAQAGTTSPSTSSNSLPPAVMGTLLPPTTVVKVTSIVPASTNMPGPTPGIPLLPASVELASGSVSASGALLTPVPANLLTPALDPAEKLGKGLPSLPAAPPAAESPEKVNNLTELQLLAQPPPPGPADVLPDLTPTPARQK